jgi:hypothetical protein
MPVHACGDGRACEGGLERGGEGSSSEAEPARGSRVPSSEAELARGGLWVGRLVGPSGPSWHGPRPACLSETCLALTFCRF